MYSMRPQAWVLIAIPAGLLFSSPPAENAFEKNVLPIFQAKCQQCHNARAMTKDLNLMSIEGVLKGGESGPVLVAGKRDESLLYRLVRDGQMPPNGKSRLSDEELAAIGAWIDSGAAGAAKLTQHDVIPVL